jgi:hypothetical protein
LIDVQPHDADACLSERAIPLLVLASPIAMHASVDLDAEFHFGAVEVEDEAAAYRLLPPKLQATEAASPEVLPEQLLGRRGATT